MLAALVPLARGAEDLTPVRLLGLVIGAALLWYAIRRMFPPKKKK
jgi:hypothetical protein